MYFNRRITLDRTARLSVIALAILGVFSCASTSGPAQRYSEKDEKEFTQPLRPPKAQEELTSELRTESDEDVGSLVISRPPKLSVDEGAKQAELAFVPTLSEKKIAQQSYNNLPIRAFINEVYGNQLGLNFVIEPTLSKAPDLVTMRLNSQLSEKDLYVLATKTLEGYGISTFEKDGVLVFDYVPEAADGDVPIIATGLALPDVPRGNRPVFYLYPLKSVATPEVNGVLSQMFSRKEITIREDMYRNALIISGKSSKVRQVVEAVKLLDKPSMSGMASAIISPVISTVDELTNQLRTVLSAEGFNVKANSPNTPIRFLPLESTGQLVVFAKSEEVLDYILEWAEKFEEERQTDVSDGLFTYQVQSTQAEHVVKLLTSLGVASGTGVQSGNNNAANAKSGGANNNSRTVMAVDEKLNTILFSGSGKEWLRTLSLIKKLDRPAPSVMIEVVLLEVSLEEEEKSAIEWLFNSGLGSYNVVGSTIGQFGQDGSGFSLNVGDGRALMNFLYDNSRTRIRSRPRVMVQSGAEASIEVGDRIPVLTSSVTSTAASNAPTIQNVTYQETGVLLNIKPTVHATGFVDIQISQELSEASSTDSGFESSPVISSRRIETILTLRDGGSVLIGGLIRATDSNGDKGIPGLGKLPILGKLFSGENKSFRRTEMLMMVIPYSLNGPDEVEALTDDLQKARMDELTQ